MKTNYKPITKEIGCYKFYGFYETMFSYSDKFIDYEQEDKNILKEKYNINNIEIEYEYDNYQQYTKDVTDLFMEYYIEKINDILPSTITNDKHYIFEKINNTLTIISPQYYNYTTDKPYIKIKTNYYTLNLIKEYTLKQKGCEEYIKNNFTSYDGFISFITNNYNTWKKTPIQEYEENMLIALLDMLIELDDENNIFNLHYEVYEDTYELEYTTPYIIENNEYTNKKELHEYIKDYLNKHINLNLNKPFKYTTEAYDINYY